MKKLTYALAAVATLAIGAPTIANAAGVGVYVGGDRDYDGPRARVYGHDRGWHEGHGGTYGPNGPGRDAWGPGHGGPDRGWGPDRYGR